MRPKGVALLSIVTAPVLAVSFMTIVMFAIHGEIASLTDETQLFAITVVGILSFAAAIVLTGGRRFIDDIKYFHPWGSSDLRAGAADDLGAFDSAVLTERIEKVH
jgi:hypothetical protein